MRNRGCLDGTRKRRQRLIATARPSPTGRRVGTNSLESRRTSTAVEVLPIPEGVDLEEGQLMRITDVTEKPPLEEVKSEYAVVGRYLLDPAVFTALENIEPGAGGEYQLTDGYARMIDLPEEEGGGLYGVVIDERRFDTGDKLGSLEANVTLALEDPALGGELREFLRSKLED